MAPFYGVVCEDLLRHTGDAVCDVDETHCSCAAQVVVRRLFDFVLNVYGKQ